MSVLRGIIHGKTIELEHDPALPDGQEVSVSLEPLKTKMNPGDGLAQSFGAWKDIDEKEMEEMERLLSNDRGGEYHLR